ncbi:nucleotidyltransferase [Niastella vici]|nr:nucleotidyltransferase [Niastella vici]
MMTMNEKANTEALEFYREALQLLQECGASYMIGGAFAIFHHTGIYRDTKDLDIYCAASEYPRILKYFGSKGYRTELTDIRWLAKIFKGEYYIDIIFDTPNNICRVDEEWFLHAYPVDFLGFNIKILSPEELVWCKIYVQNRERYDGADINHLLLKQGKTFDWKRLARKMDQHWHLLLMQILSFQFVYPSEFHTIIPKWLFDDLMARAAEQYEIPAPMEKVCRGPVIDQTQYAIDIKEWGYKSYTLKTV